MCARYIGVSNIIGQGESWAAAQQNQMDAAIRAAAPNTFMAFSVPLVAAASEAEAVRLAYDAMTIGADAIMKAEIFTVLVGCWQ